MQYQKFEAPKNKPGSFNWIAEPRYDLHAELCDLCRKVFCGSCLFQHMKEPHAKPAIPILDERIQKRPA